MKDNIIKAETKMLNEMGFLVYVEHPHKFIPKYLQSLGRDEESLMQIAWNYANDSLRTPLCLKFPPEAIATGCVALTARKVGLALPDELRWWELFDTKESQVDEVAWTILQLYKQPKAKYISLRLQAQAANEVKEIESRSRSKSRGSSQVCITPPSSLIPDRREANLMKEGGREAVVMSAVDREEIDKTPTKGETEVIEEMDIVTDVAIETDTIDETKEEITETDMIDEKIDEMTEEIETDKIETEGIETGEIGLPAVAILHQIEKEIEVEEGR